MTKEEDLSARKPGNGDLSRVLISSSTFPLPRQKGLPRFVYDLSEALAQRAEVRALVPDAPQAERRELLGSVEVRRFSYFRPRRWQRLAYGHGMRANLRSLLGKIQVPLFLAAQTAAIRSQLRSQRTQLLNSHWLVPQGLTAALAMGANRKVAHVLSVHAADVHLLQRLPFGRALARFVLDRTDFVFADGSGVREDLDHLLGRPSGAVLQPMGVHLESFRSGPGLDPGEQPFADGFLLFFGRFTEKKGILYLLRALPRILEHYPRLGLIAIGYGELEEALRRESRKLGLEEAVLFPGRLAHSDIGRYLRDCRVAVVPSVIDRNGETDGMPTVVVEAMASGARVVGTAVDGIPDVIRHGENGWLCREKDPRDLADKILTALEDPSPSPVPRQAAETAEALDWSQVAARYLKVFQEVLASRREDLSR